MKSDLLSLALRALILLALSGAMAASLCAQEPPNLEGLWKAYKRFDVDHQGPLLIDADAGWAEFAGRRAVLEIDSGRWSVEFSPEHGRFSGYLVEEGPSGHWIQPSVMQLGAEVASPVRFTRLSEGSWRGQVTPMPSQFTFYLPIERSEDGSLKTFLRNPERNLGVFAQVEELAVDGNDLQLIGRFRGSDETQALLRGRYHPDSGHFTLDLPAFRGGSYDFYRESDPEQSEFRARPPGEWRYAAPPALNDGWPTGTLADARIDEERIRTMIEQEILPIDEDVQSLNVHGLLVARGGVLVLEEYFHGFHRDLPHDTRSAGKSLGSVLAGAIQHQGVDISPETRVYEALGESMDGLDPRKRAMTLEHLLTMDSGFYCDDGDGNAPGNENILQSQSEQPDWYRYTLDLPMANAPGEAPVYCSANSNLIGAVVSARSGRPLRELVQDLIAEPMQIPSYHLNLQPTGELYLGGGSHWRARDYMKLPQMMLNGGTWNGRRIVSEDWARQSVAETVQIGGRPYGWQWWVIDYEWLGETVRAFFAAGNGGQIFMGIPAADLVIAFWGGNYSASAGRLAQSELIPNHILPATRPIHDD
ncbi:MAG: serine hydrolase [Pseudomonadota bacterium]